MKIDPYPPHSKGADIRCYSDQASQHITSNSQENFPIGISLFPEYFVTQIGGKIQENFDVFEM